MGVDGSANSAVALRWAVGEAQLRRARVVALFAWGFIPPGHSGNSPTFEADYSAADAEEALGDAVRAAVGPTAASGIEHRVLYELPPEALLAAATGADMLVVGARGVGGFRGLMLGSVSGACLHHTTAPLAIVRDTERDPAGRGEERVPGATAGGRIVVGVDGSDSARRALRWTLDEARRRDACVDVVHAWQPSLLMPTAVATMPGYVDAMEKAARGTLDGVVDGEDLRRQPAPVERILVRGGAARSVLEVAEGADLVVLGTRGLGGFRGLLLGSVTHHVAHHATCPLVVIP